MNRLSTPTPERSGVPLTAQGIREGMKTLWEQIEAREYRYQQQLQKLREYMRPWEYLLRTAATTPVYAELYYLMHHAAFEVPMHPRAYSDSIEWLEAQGIPMVERE